MSNATVTVCLAPTPPGDVYGAIGKAMEPYALNSEATSLAGREWDHWRIDAGDDRRYPVNPAFDGDPRLIYADQWESTPNRKRLPLQCDGGPISLLDLDQMRINTADDARVEWNWRLGNPNVNVQPPAESLTVFIAARVQWAIATFALLTLDGLWIDPDTPGPFLDVLPDTTRTDAYDHQRAVHAREATRYIESLADDCIIVQLRYHC